jgi:hypothetical protein
MIPTPSFDFGPIVPHPIPPLATKLPAGLAVQGRLNPDIIPSLRDKLLTELPHVPELERLRIWPWWPWTPWFDCSPDIIFRVTQKCDSQIKTIVAENVFQTRWDIPTNCNVTLIANKDACCLHKPDRPPEGDCVVISGVCGDPGIPVTHIGGNAGAPANPAGYADPGGRDRPFSESVYISGQFGTAAQADYYEIEYTPHGLAAWAPVPPGALGGMTRGYFDATQPWPNQWFNVSFPVKTFGTRHVYESRRHYETTHGPANWGNAMGGRTWYYNVNQIAEIQSSGIFTDGVYDFRIAGYKALANGALDPSTRKVLDGCGDPKDKPEVRNNFLALCFDNRFVGSPTPGTVHINTSEPDCGIAAVRLGGAPIEPCGMQKLELKTSLEIDFFVTDNPASPEPNAHLDHYTLTLKYDQGGAKNLLDSAQVGSLSYTAGAGVSVGPDYANAVAPSANPPESAIRPHWKGGKITLHIDDASKVFPKTCCYLIELTAWKRNIVSCDGHLNYYNQTNYSFTVLV